MHLITPSSNSYKQLFHTILFSTILYNHIALSKLLQKPSNTPRATRLRA